MALGESVACNFIISYISQINLRVFRMSPGMYPTVATRMVTGLDSTNKLGQSCLLISPSPFDMAYVLPSHTTPPARLVYSVCGEVILQLEDAKYSVPFFCGAVIVTFRHHIIL